MKTIVLFAIVTIWIGLYAQTETVWYRNDIQVNIGKTFYDGFSKGEYQKGLNRFSTLISYDGFLTNNFSIGVFGGLTYSSLKDSSYYVYYPWWGETGYYNHKRKDRRYVLGVRGTSYLYNIGGIQIFLGTGIGLGFFREYRLYVGEPDGYESDRKQLTFMWDAHLGANYYFYKNIGVTARIGYPLSMFKVGMSFRY